ncbi:MAG: endonuclease/exonuclease/phosphatase family protein [Acidimicrobiales bacterium]
MPELTIASYNIHWGRGPKRLGCEPFDVVAACRRLDADVLVLQESWAPDDGPSDHQRVADALGMVVAVDVSLARSVIDPEPRVVSRERTTGRRGRRADDSGTGGWHLAALSRAPVVSSSVDPLPHLWYDHSDRAVVACAVVVDGAPLEVRGTHLPHLEYGAHLSTRGLRRSLPPTEVPAVFIGDMNMWGWTIDRMVPPGWRRVVRGKTYPSLRPHSQIDHLLVTPSVEALWGEVGPDLGSDHLPIRARLRW